MKLKDLKIGQKFLFIDNEFLTDVYVKKGEINKEYCIVGLPGVDTFAVRLDTDVMEQPDEDLGMYDSVSDHYVRMGYCDGFKDDEEQEQQEVELEKELKSFLNSDNYLNSPGDGYLLVAHHFYELGKNSK